MGKKIFLVEDNPDNADLLVDLLEDEYEIEWHPDPLKALKALTDYQSKLPDIFLLDISLPKMEGTTLLKRIRDLPLVGQIPAIALTAHAMKSDRESFIQIGFNGYLSKPIVDLAQLTGLIEELTK